MRSYILWAVRRVISILVIMLIPLTSAACVNVETSKDEPADTLIIIPYSYSLTEQSAGQCKLAVECFLSDPSGKYSDKQNYAAIAIVSGEQNLPASWFGDLQIAAESTVSWRGTAFYLCTLPLLFCQPKGIELAGAHLQVQWNDGNEERLYLGDLSFKLAGEKSADPSAQLGNSAGTAQPVIRSATISPIGRLNKHGLYELPAIGLELDLSEDILLKEIDLGLSNYGIDPAKIVLCRGGQIESVQLSMALKTIFDEYDLSCRIVPRGQITSGTGDLLLPKGNNLLIIPITSTLADVAIKCTGMRLAYSMNGQTGQTIISQKKLFDQASFTDTALKYARGQ